MSDKVVFFRPVEKVDNIVMTLLNCKHSFFPVVDPDDNGVLFGTIGRNELCVLLQQRAFGHPAVSSSTSMSLTANNQTRDSNSNQDVIEYKGQTFVPLVQWAELEKADNPRYPEVHDIVHQVLREGDYDCFMDLRPYANTAPITIQQKASLGVRGLVDALISSWFFLCCLWIMFSVILSSCAPRNAFPLLGKRAASIS